MQLFLNRISWLRMWPHSNNPLHVLITMCMIPPHILVTENFIRLTFGKHHIIENIEIQRLLVKLTWNYGIITAALWQRCIMSLQCKGEYSMLWGRPGLRSVRRNVYLVAPVPVVHHSLSDRHHVVPRRQTALQSRNRLKSLRKQRYGYLCRDACSRMRLVPVQLRMASHW